MSTPSMKTKVASIQQLITGIQKNAPNLVLILASQSYTSPQIVALLQSLVTAANLVLSTKSTWHDAVVANDQLEKQQEPLVALLRSQIASMYSNAETTLAEFGLTPRKPRKPLTTEALAARAAKAAATRKARGTTSKKQKAAVTGNVTGVTITPVTSGASTAPAPAASTAAPAAPVPPPVSSVATSPATPVTSSGTSNGAAAGTVAAPHA